jgi:hypothetical protein
MSFSFWAFLGCLPSGVSIPATRLRCAPACDLTFTDERMTRFSAPRTNLRWFVPLLFLLVFTACDSAGPQGERGDFSATIDGSPPLTLSGEADFGKMTAVALLFQQEAFAITLKEVSGPERTIYFSRNDTTAPGPGTYPLRDAVNPSVEELDPSQFFAFMYLEDELVHSTGGELVITSNANGRLSGEFNFPAEPSRSSSGERTTSPVSVTINGEFDAVPR